jgi:hypothetical protein
MCLAMSRLITVLFGKQTGEIGSWHGSDMRNEFQAFVLVKRGGGADCCCVDGNAGVPRQALCGESLALRRIPLSQDGGVWEYLTPVGLAPTLPHSTRKGGAPSLFMRYLCDLEWRLEGVGHPQRRWPTSERLLTSTSPGRQTTDRNSSCHTLQRFRSCR